MLQFSEFHAKLLNTLCRRSDDGQVTEHAQSLVLDALCWLAGVHSNGPGRLIIRILFALMIILWLLGFRVQIESLCSCFSAQRKEMSAYFQKHENVFQILSVSASLKQDEV